MLLLSACQGFEPTQINGFHGLEERPIFGGKSVNPDSSLADLVVGLQFVGKDGATQTCTAAWIADDWLLTAAHCLPENKNDLSVFQTVDLSEESKVLLKVHQMISHPEAARTKKLLISEKKYEVGNRHDVALLQVAGYASHANFVLDKTTPDGKLMNLAKTILHLKVLGYGAQEVDLLMGISQTLARLQETTLDVPNGSKDGVIYVKQSGDTGICLGDSGAPLFGKKDGNNLLLGVASSVRNPGSSAVCHGESRFVAIGPHYDWIQSIVDAKHTLPNSAQNF